jgi:alkanesulfonate monooxygenase SsuD/methylene tetrahydromethanopterin reductase-like flavin-dependent oxidoreductase (luciferase family)
MKIGIGLPTWLGNIVTGRDVTDFARRADTAGFHALVVHDRPFHDTWDPLATLATVAPVTSRIRLATGALLLPMRDEANVAKQANVIDLVSEGRLDLGLAVGSQPEAFGLFGNTPARRGRIFDAQLERLNELFAAAVASSETGDGAGPASFRRPRPSLWIGGYTPAAVDRAVRHGDAFLFGAPDVEMMRDRIPGIREAASKASRGDFPIGGLAYVLPSTDDAQLAEGERLLTRYYGTLRKPFLDLVWHGAPEALGEQLEAYRSAGLDVLHVIPVSRDPGVVDVLAGALLPRFAGPSAG